MPAVLIRRVEIRSKPKTSKEFETRLLPYTVSDKQLKKPLRPAAETQYATPETVKAYHADTQLTER
jgi:hypothetical protein